jgi:hypothetical protein
MIPGAAAVVCPAANLMTHIHRHCRRVARVRAVIISQRGEDCQSNHLGILIQKDPSALTTHAALVALVNNLGKMNCCRLVERGGF